MEALFWVPGASLGYSGPPLVEGTEYLVALRVVDDAGNRSAVSPILFAETDHPDNYAAWSATPSDLLYAGPLRESALAFAGGLPAVAFTPTDQEVRVTRHDGTGWTPPEVVESGRKLGQAVRLADVGPDVGGRLGLAYGGNTVVKYREHDGTSWGPATVLESGNRTSYALGSLVATADGPVLSYSGPAGLVVARRVGAEWVKVVVAEGAVEHALAVSPADGTLGLAYTLTEAVPDGKMYRLYFATSPDGGATWSAGELVDEALWLPIGSYNGPWMASVGRYLSLAFDGSGTPYASYLSGHLNLSTTVLARRTETGWETEDIGDGWPASRALLVDADGRFYVAASPEGAAVVATRGLGDTAWAPELVSYPGESLDAVALAMGLSGPAAAFAVRTASGAYELRYADRASTAVRAGGEAAAYRAGEGPLEGSTPEAVTLSGAYPNPFGSTTTFELRLDHAQAVRAEAFDALGRRVAVLHDGELGAGLHRLTLSGSSLPSGLYLVRFTGSGVAATRLVSLLR